MARPHDAFFEARKTAGLPDMDQKPVPKTVVASPAVTVELYKMRAAHGDLWHPYQKVWFTTEKDTPALKDLWCDTQIEAGKLKLA